MAENDEPGAGAIDLKVDPSTYVLAAIFGIVAFPPNMPEHLKQSILDKAEQARTADGSIGGNRMDQDERRREAVRESEDDNLSALANIAQQEREEREREEWARTKSTVAGVTMTGTEWAQLAERLRNDGELREEIMAAFRKRGMSEEEAERRYERVADITAIAAKPESQRTEQEAEDFEKAKADPSFEQDMNVVQSITKQEPAAARSAKPVNEANPNIASAPVETARLDF